MEHKTSGFVGEFVTTTDVLNNRIDQWTINFSGILGGPINVPKTNNDLSDIYLNFFLFKNNKEKGWVRPYIYNDVLEDSLAFAYNLPVTQGNGEWALVSIPFKSLKTEYGNNFSMKARDYLSLNKLKFVFTHSDKEKERKNTPVSQLKTAVGDVQFYIDHIIITQGGAYVNPPKF